MILKEIFKYKVPKDPVKHCKLYKQEGCVHVDGYLCNVDTCRERKLYEIFILEQELDIPTNLRLYKCKPELYNEYNKK